MGKRWFPTRRSGFLKPKKFIVVATEGRRTEEHYLHAFKPPRDSTVQMVVLPSVNNKSRPKECLNRLLAYASDRGLGAGDELWVMIDRDHWSSDELDEVARELARRRNHFLALSNPCVEYWFYLHFRDPKPFQDGQKVIRALGKLLRGYQKDQFETSALKKGLSRAIERARKEDADPQAAWPKRQGTRVYRLMERFATGT